MTEKLFIRHATVEDIDTLVDFNQAMASETEDKVLDKEVLTAGVGHLFDHSEDGFYLIAEMVGRPVGSLLVTYEWSDWRNGRIWWIQSVYTVPERRGQGIYRTLYDRVRQLAKQQGNVRGFRLYAESDNQTAHRTYRAVGMQEARYRMFEQWD